MDTEKCTWCRREIEGDPLRSYSEGRITSKWYCSGICLIYHGVFTRGEDILVWWAEMKKKGYWEAEKLGPILAYQHQKLLRNAYPDDFPHSMPSVLSITVEPPFLDKTSKRDKKHDIEKDH